MKRSEYLKARRMVRDNGRYAIGWMPIEQRETFDILFFGQRDDPLAWRAGIIDWCKREGIECNVRHTAMRKETGR